MQNKKPIIAIIIGAVVVLAAVAVYFIYANSDYVTYSSAFKKTFNVNSMELNTQVKAVADGTTINSSGVFKLKDVSTTPQFINTMTISGSTITQFGDGAYIYTDDGQSKNKIKINADPDPHQEKNDSDFSFEAYISEFSSLLDASKIKELGSLEPVAEKYVDKISVTKNSSGDRKFEVTLLPAMVDELITKVINENLSSAMSPTVVSKSLLYTTTVSDGYVSAVTLKMELDVTPPNETTARDVTVDFTIKPVNPGQSVSFSLPSTDGF